VSSGVAEYGLCRERSGHCRSIWCEELRRARLEVSVGSGVNVHARNGEERVVGGGTAKPTGSPVVCGAIKLFRQRGRDLAL
jgi:hypothetical protein